MVLSRPQSFYGKLRLTRDLLLDDVAFLIRERESVLKLLRESPATVCGHLEEQTVLRVFEIQTTIEFAGAMDPLADDTRGIKSGRALPGHVTRNTTAGSNQQDVASVRVLLLQNRKNILR